MSLPRVGFIKLDLQGMELEALDGAQQVARCHPIFLLESRRVGREHLRAFLDERGYKVVEAGYNLLAVHKSDPVVQQPVAGHAGAIGSPTASPLHSLAAVVATASSRIGA